MENLKLKNLYINKIKRAQWMSSAAVGGKIGENQ